MKKEITQILPHLIYPENEKTFKYISQFYKYTPINSIYSKEKIDSLLKDEKTYHDMILNPFQYKTTRLKAWGKYIQFISQLIQNENKINLRIIILLEYFTKLMYNEKENYNEEDYISYWNFYAENCRDDYEILEKLYQNNICIRNPHLYIGMSYIYERYHAFKKADESFLKGFEIKCNKEDILINKYKEFENRMLNRINREMNLSFVDSEEIDKYIHNEIISKNNNKNENITRKRLNIERNTFYDEKIVIQIAFKIIDKKIIIYNEGIQNDKIKKGTQLVELYKLIIDYLNNHDSNFKANSDNFINDLNSQREKKPYSWLSNKRNENPNLNTILDNIIEQNHTIFNEINYNNNLIMNGINNNNNNSNNNNQIKFHKLDIINNKNIDSNPHNNNNNNEQKNKTNHDSLGYQSVNDIAKYLEKQISEEKTAMTTNNKSTKEFLNKESKEIEEHKKKIEKIKNELEKELEIVKIKEKKLKLIEEEMNKRLQNKKNILGIEKEKNKYVNHDKIPNFTKNLEKQNNSNLLGIIPEKNSNLNFSINLKEFLSNKSITMDDISLKISEIEKLYNENKISLIKKKQYVSLLEDALKDIHNKEEFKRGFQNKTNFNEIKPLFPNLIDSETNKQNPFFPSPIQNKNINNEFSFSFSNSNNKNLTKKIKTQNNWNFFDDEFENLNNNNDKLTPNLNTFFDDNKKDVQKKELNNSSKKFEKLFFGNDELDNDNKNDKNKLKNSFSNLNDTFELVKKSNSNQINNSSMTEKNNDSRNTDSIEKLFNS